MFIDTRGRTKIAIGICGRCSCKMPYDELYSDPNAPGLYVCKDDLDDLDPWRLPAAPTEDITLDHARPDVSISTFSPQPVFAQKINGISTYYPNVVWLPNAVYRQGQMMTTVNPDPPAQPSQPSVTLPVPQYLALTAGTSEASAAAFPTEPGVLFHDGTITWLVLGLYLM